MCRVLEVSESGFYAWRKRPPCQHAREDAQLREEIRQEFRVHCGRYGSPRLHAELRDRGRSIARKRVARLMTRQQGCVRANGGRCLPRAELAPFSWSLQRFEMRRVKKRFDVTER